MPRVSSRLAPKSARTGRCWKWRGPGGVPCRYGILLADEETGGLTLRLRDPDCFDDLEEQEADFLAHLPGDLAGKRPRDGRRASARRSGRRSFPFPAGERPDGDRYTGAIRSAAADRLFDEHVDAAIRPFVTHLPLYGLRAAATKFGEGMESERGGLAARAAKPASDGRDVCGAGRGPLDGTAHPGWQPLHFPRARDGLAAGTAGADREIRRDRFLSRATPSSAMRGTGRPRRIGGARGAHPARTAQPRVRDLRTRRATSFA